MQRAAAHATRKIGRSKTRAALVENLWKQMRIPVRSAVLYTVTSVDGRPSPSRAGSQNVYPGGIEVPKLGCALPRRLTCPSRLSISCNAPGLRHRGTYWKPAGVSTASCAGVSALRHGIFVSTTPPDPPVSSAFSYCSRLTDSSPIKLQHPVAQVRRSSTIGSSLSRTSPHRHHAPAAFACAWEEC